MAAPGHRWPNCALPSYQTDFGHQCKGEPYDGRSLPTRKEVKAAYQLIVQFIEDYRYDLVASAGPDDLQKWWADRSATGVWGPPPPKDQDREDN